MRTECREGAVVVGTAESALGTQAESPTREWYHVARTFDIHESARLVGCPSLFNKSKGSYAVVGSTALVLCRSLCIYHLGFCWGIHPNVRAILSFDHCL